MRTALRSARPGVALLCLGAGVAASLWLHSALQPRLDWQRLLKLPAAVPVKVGMTADEPHEASALNATQEGLPSAAAAQSAPPESPAPRRARSRYKVQAERSAPPEQPEGASSRETPGPTEGTGWQDLPTLSQPEFAAVSSQPLLEELPAVPADPSSEATAPVLLPVVEGAELPAVPPEQPQYAEQPGGEVLVMEVFVNERGEVVEARIAVPSAYPLDDFGHLLIERRARWSHMVPPMLPGEIRKYERRIDYRLRRSPQTDSSLP